MIRICWIIRVRVYCDMLEETEMMGEWHDSIVAVGDRTWLANEQIGL